MRLRAVKNARQRLALHEGLVVFEPAEYCGKWHEVFGNEQEIHLEIGMGKGQFLAKQAQKHPQINYIGLEKQGGIAVKAAEKIAKQNISNLRIIQTDALLLETLFSQGEIAKIFLNFSDPWPKARHAKRRLTADSFLKTYQKILSPVGEIELKTDNPRFFEYSILSFAKNRFKFVDVSVDLHARGEEIITTEYEERFLALRQLIYYLKVKVKEQ